jgi:hypothetical protein
MMPEYIHDSANQIIYVTKTNADYRLVFIADQHLVIIYSLK